MQIPITNFNVFRADRQNRTHGGVLLYIHKSILIIYWEIFDDKICQGIFCVSVPSKITISCVYKPGVASDKSFSNLLQFLESCFKQIPESHDFTNIVLGDLNFPNRWQSNYMEISGKTKSERNLLSFLDTHFLSQYVDKATRKSNILDLCFTNNNRLVHAVRSRSMIFLIII